MPDRMALPQNDHDLDITAAFYFMYFVILLVHRERRDYVMCLQKYGRDWEAYCRKVRWRIVPGLY